MNGKQLSAMAVSGSGGEAPSSPSALTATPASDGQGVALAWTPPPPPKGDSKAALTYEVLREGVVVAEQLSTPSFVDGGCGLGRRCRYTVDAVTAGGRSATVKTAATTLGTKPPVLADLGPLLKPGVDTIAGKLGHGSGDARPVTVTLLDVVHSVTLTLPATSSGTGFTASLPKTFPPSAYRVSVAQGSFTSPSVAVAIAAPVSLSAALSGTSSGAIPQAVGLTVTVSGGAMATPPGSAVIVKVVSAPEGTSKTKPLSRADLARAASQGSTLTTKYAMASASSSWSIPVTLPSLLSQVVLLVVTQSNNPGLVQTPVYFELLTSGSTVPSAPNGVTASSMQGKSKVTVHWTAPSSNGGSAITGYNVTLSPGGGTCQGGPRDTSCVADVPADGFYTARVWATNAMGSSLPAASAPVQVGAPPVSPPSASLTLVAGSLNVIWQASPTVGVTRYVAMASPGGQSCSYQVPSSGPEVDGCTISGLTQGNTYVVGVTAFLANGVASQPTSTAPILNATIPDAPTALAASPRGDGWVDFSWSHGASNGGVYLTGYQLSVEGVGVVCTTSWTTCAAKLTMGQRFSVSLTASNQVGASAPATLRFANSLMPFQPFQPGTSIDGLSLGQLKVSWPANPITVNTSPPTSYTATASQSGKSCSVDFSGAQTYSCIISGLTLGSTVTVTLVATNAAGTTDPSPASWPITMGFTPGSPRTVVASPLDGGAQVSWLPPTSNGGSAITSYVATAIPGGQTCTYTVAAPELDACTITGLTNGASVSFSVVATNAIGSSTPSAASAAIAVGAVPGAPTGVRLSPGNRSITISWSAPASSGTSALTSYTARESNSGATCTTTSQGGAAPATTCTLIGLTPLNLALVTVLATNAIGNSPPSGSVSTTVLGPPSAPRTVTAAPGDGALSVSWLAPTSNGGSAITSYVATAIPGGQTCTYTVVVPEVDACTITGLTNGTAYSVTVVATNLVATSVPSSPSGTSTPDRVAAAPTGVLVTPGDGTLRVSWQPPAANGGTAITSYVATATPGGKTCTYTVVVPEVDACTITGLTNGTAYSVTVRALNTFGTSTASTGAQATPVGVPGAATGVVVSTRDAALLVSWQPPSFNGGTAITSYVATATPGGKTCTYTVVVPEVDACTITGLTNGTAYSVTVVANNVLGASPTSSARTGTPAGPPGAPGQLSAAPKDLSATVSWTAPSSNGGSPVTSYEVTATPSAARCSATAPATSCTLTGLLDGTTYAISVVAKSAGGTSSASTTTVVPYGPSWAARPPSVPLDVAVTPGAGSVVLSWTRPADDGLGALHGYTATLQPGGAQCTATPVQTSCTVNGTDDFAVYTATVTATNAAGTSDPSTRAADASRCGLSPSAPCYTPSSRFGAPNAVSAVTQPDTTTTVTFARSGPSYFSRLYGISYVVQGSPEPVSCPVTWVVLQDNYQCTINQALPANETIRVQLYSSYFAQSGEGWSAPSFPVPVATSPAPTFSLPLASKSPELGFSSAAIAANPGGLGGSLSVVAQPVGCTSTCSAQRKTFTGTLAASGKLALPGLADGTWELTATWTLTGAGGLTAASGSKGPLLVQVETQPPSGLSISSVGQPEALRFGQQNPTASVVGSCDGDPTATWQVAWYSGTSTGGVAAATRVPRVQSSGPDCSFEDQARGLPDGQYTVVVTETNAVGLSASASVLVNVKTAQPTVAMSAPQTSSTQPVGAVKVAGTGSMGLGDSAVNLIASNGRATVTTTAAVVDGRWSTTMSLRAGTWDITASRLDLDRRQTSASTSVSVVAGYPLALVQPLSGAVIGTSTTVVATGAGRELMEVSVDGNSAGSARARPDGLVAIAISGLSAGSHEIAVDDEQGNQVTVTVSVGGTPTFSIGALGAGGSARMVTIWGSAPAGDRVSCDVSGTSLGTATASAGGTWSLSIDSLADANYTLSCADGAARLSTALVVDRTAPVLSIDGPSGLTADRVLRVNASTSPGDGVDATFSYYQGSSPTGQAVKVQTRALTPGVQNVAMPADLTDGTWTVVATRTDAAGNQGTSRSTFVLAATPPRLVSSIPRFAAGPLHLTGIAGVAASDLAPSVAIDGGTPRTVSVSADGSFSILTAIVSGTHQITIVQATGAGVATTIEGQVTVESTPPSLTINAQGAPTVAITGTVVGGDGLPLNVEAIPGGGGSAVTTVITPSPDGSWSWSPTLANGPTTISVVTANGAGIAATATTSFVVDTTVPDLDLTATPATSTSSSLLVAGMSSAETWRTSTVEVVATSSGGGLPVSATARVGADGAWSARLELTDGAWTVVATRDDPAGASHASTSVLVVTQRPVLTMAAPSSTVNRICGKAGTGPFDEATLSVLFSGSGHDTVVPVTPVSGAWCVAPPNDGTFNVTATQRNQAGGTTSVAVAGASFQVVPPPVSLAPIVANSWNAYQWHFDCDVRQAPYPGEGCAQRVVASISGTASTAALATPKVAVQVAKVTSCPGRAPSWCQMAEARTVEVAVESDGTFTLSLKDFADGLYKVVSASQEDSAGNVGTWSASTCDYLDEASCNGSQYFFVVDHTAPTAPTLYLSEDPRTDTHNLMGTFCPDTSHLPSQASVQYFAGASATGTPVATSELPTTCSVYLGSRPWWLLSLKTGGLDLPDGTYTAVAISSTALATSRSAPVTFDLNAVRPTPVVSGLRSGAAATPGPSAAFGSTPNLVGRASMGPFDARSVSLTITQVGGDQSWTSRPGWFMVVPVADDGTWSWSLPADFPAGDFHVQVRQADLYVSNYWQEQPGTGDFTISSAVATVTGYTAAANGAITLMGTVPAGRSLDYARVHYDGPAKGYCDTNYSFEVSGTTWSCRSMSTSMPNGTYSVTIDFYTGVCGSNLNLGSHQNPADDVSPACGDQNVGATASLLIDSIAPTPTITSPSDTWPLGLVPSPVALSGTASVATWVQPSVSISASDGSSTVTATANVVGGTWSSSMSLGNGQWTVTVSQANKTGGVGSTTVEFIVDSTPPAIAITYPPAGSTVASPYIGGTLSGAPGNATGLDSWQNASFSAGTASYYRGSSASGAPVVVHQINTCEVCSTYFAKARPTQDFSDQPSLAAGTWTVVVSATSRSGVTATQSRTFTVDPTAKSAPTFATATSLYSDTSRWARVYGGALGATATLQAGVHHLSARVSGIDGPVAEPTPSGTITFYSGSTAVGSGSLDSSGWADATVTLLPGTYALRAAYAAAGSALASSSGTTQVVVNASSVDTGGMRIFMSYGAGAINMTDSRYNSVSLGFTYGQGAGQCFGGNVAITDASGTLVASGPLGPQNFDGQFSPGAWFSTNLALPMVSPVAAGAASYTATLSGGGNCQGSISLVATARDSNLALGAPSSPSSTGVGKAITLSGVADGGSGLQDGWTLATVPVNLVDADGHVVATTRASRETGWAYSLTYTPTRVGMTSLTVVAGGPGSSYAQQSASVSLAVEPSTVALSLGFSPTPSHPGETTTGTLAIAPTGAAGTVTVSSASSSVTWPISCAEVCTASGSIPDDLKDAVGGSLTATYLSATTGYRYRTSTPLPRTPWQPTLQISRGAGAPLELVAQPGDHKVLVSWTVPPANDSTIQGYLVTASPGGAICNASPGQTSCMLTGLNNGTGYTFSAQTISSLGTSGFSSTNTTPVEGLDTPVADGQQATTTPGTVARDELVPVVATLTYPHTMPTSMRLGSLSLRSKPGPTCYVPYSKGPGGQLGEYVGSGFDKMWVAAWNYCADTSSWVSADLSSKVVTASGAVAQMTPSGTLTTSGDSVVLSGLLLVGGMDFSLEASYRPANAGQSAPAVATGSLTGVGPAPVSVTIGAATVTGGCYSKDQNAMAVSRCYTDGYGSQVVNTSDFSSDLHPTIGQTAYVKATLDPVLATTADLEQGWRLEIAGMGADPRFAVQGFGTQNEVTSEPHAGAYAGSLGNAGGAFSTPLGMVRCLTCYVWPLRNVTNPEGLTTAGGLVAGDSLLAVVGYKRGSGFLTAGSNDELAARTSQTIFHLTVDLAPTQQSTRIAQVGPDIHVLTAARWPGLEPEVNTDSAEISAEVIATLPDGSTRSVAYCLYAGWCASEGPGGVRYPTAGAVPVAGGLAISLAMGTYQGPSLAGATYSVETSAPWAQVIDSPSVTPSSSLGVFDAGTQASSLAVNARYLGTQLLQPDLSAPLPFLGWTNFQNMVSFWESVFGPGEMANNAVQFTIATVRGLVGPIFQVANDLIQLFQGNLSALADLGIMAGVALLAIATNGLATAAISKAAQFIAPSLAKVGGGVIRRFYTTAAQRLTLGAGAATREGAVKLGTTVLKVVNRACGKGAGYLLTQQQVAVPASLMKDQNPYFSKQANGAGCIINGATALAGTLGAEPAITAAEQWRSSLASQISTAQSEPGTASTDLGFGAGVAMQYAQAFSAQIDPKIAGVDQWSSAQRSRATLHVQLWTVAKGESSNPYSTAVNLGEIASCHLDGTSCTKVDGIDIKRGAGGFLVAGQFPQSMSWAPPGAWIRAIVTEPATTGAASSSGAPGAPTGLSVSGGAASLTATWAPGSGSAATSYTVSANGRSCETATNSCTIRGLTTGATATVSVVATNAAGTSAASTQVVDTWGYGDAAFPMNKYDCGRRVIDMAQQYGWRDDRTLQQSDMCIGIVKVQGFQQVSWRDTVGDGAKTTYGSLPWPGGYDPNRQLSPETAAYRSALPW